MADKSLMAQRFRGFMPVVLDVETGGTNPQKDALLEIGIVTLKMDNSSKLILDKSFHEHIKPFKGANLEREALEFNKIRPDHPFRFAISEEEALEKLFKELKATQKEQGCNRCVLVGHNAWFDLAFINAAAKRTKNNKNPFHPFTSFDTASLSALAFGQTVLAQALRCAEIDFDPEKAHSALYDAKVTAELFCKIVNNIPKMG